MVDGASVSGRSQPLGQHFLGSELLAVDGSFRTRASVATTASWISARARV